MQLALFVTTVASISCCALGTLLLFANRKDVRIFESSVGMNNATVIIGNLEDAAAVDFYYRDSSIFWTDVSLEAIKRTRLNETNYITDVITTGLVSPDGLAIDWIGRKIYWTDSETNRIEVANLDGTYRKVLFWQDLDQPRAISLDPLNGYMYWTDWGETPKIERAGMDGALHSRITLVKDRIYWPNGLTLDYEDSKIFWADAKLSYVASCNFDGSDRKTIISGTLPHPFALTLSGDTLYWTDWHKRNIQACNKYTGSNTRDVRTGIFSPMDIHAFTAKRQPTGQNPCDEKNGGCTHLCLMSPFRPYYSCACPTGVKLKQDGKTCAEGAEKILLLARRTDLRQISLDTMDYTDVVLPLQNIQHAIAIDYDLVEGHVYWTDDETRTISRAALDGTEQEVIINTEVDHPDGIAVDWIARNLYWTDTGTDRIEVARLNGTSRRVLISDKLEEPRAIVLDPVGGLMYWTDWGEEPKIEQANLDGSERKILVNTSLGWPNGLALDFNFGTIYWGDAQTDVIEVMYINGTGRKKLVHDKLPHIFGFGLLGDYIYWTDWQMRSIERVNKYNGNSREVIIDQLPDLMGLKAVNVRLLEGTNACANNNGGCSHLCLNRPQGPVCACPMWLELETNGRTCIVPEAFLLLSRRADIRFISLERHSDMVIPLSGVKEASALDFDISDSRIYWTDVSLKSINRAFMNGSSLEHIVEYGLEFPEGMAVDWVAHNIYWADTGTNRIEMARLDGNSRKVLIWKDIQNPRAIALDPPKGYMYWSDWGDEPKIERAALDGTHRTVLIRRIGRANGLTLDYADARLYWTDLDKNIIESASLLGFDRQLVVKEALPHPFSLTQYEDFIYWTDWETGSIERANKSTGENRTRIQGHLNFVMDILVFHASRQSGWNSCGRSNGGCSHICVAHSSDYESLSLHHCACPTHYSLDSDNKTCLPPDNFLLISQKNKIRRMILDEHDALDMVLPLNTLRMVRAIAFDPLESHLFWIDGRSKTIRRARDTDLEATTIVPNPQPEDIFQPYGVDIDPYARLLYWSDSLNNVINVTGLDGRGVGVVIGGKDQKPRAIALAPKKGLLFWINLFEPLRIERAAMDGTAKMTLVLSNSVGSPHALAVDEEEERIYWSDMELKRIEVADFGGGNRKLLTTASEAVALVVQGDYIYWIDKKKQTIERMNKKDGSDRITIQSRLGHLSDIFAVNRRQMFNVSASHPCFKNRKGCSHLCLVQKESEKARCSCPMDLELSKDEKTCEEPPTCATNEFSCLSGGISCIPSLWQCDGYKECEDGSDELNCPTCSDDQFQCKSGQCVLQTERCNDIRNCQDGTDEDDCPPCEEPFILCEVDKKCIEKSKECDGEKSCSDGQDERGCSAVGPVTGTTQITSTTAKYTVIIVVVLLLFVMALLMVIVFACRKKANHLPLDESRDNMLTKPLYPSSGQTTPPHNTLSSRGKSGTTCLTLSSSLPPGVPPLYDRNHLTGCSSSSSAVTHYAPETLNPPPSPVTDRSQCTTAMYCYSSVSPSTVCSSRRHYHHHHHRHHRHIPPPPTTPCSTDVCEDSEPYSKKYYTSFAELNYDSDPFYPPPPTPRSHCFTDEPSCPPSPSTERSFNPYPPPPSPVCASDC